ncbi:hypothetical protein FRC17_002408 [Serendipita sp. 399]|nr:hypothetical protein FRC17_002408 [Serendipita sp. 399]
MVLFPRPPNTLFKTLRGRSRSQLIASRSFLLQHSPIRHNTTAVDSEPDFGDYLIVLPPDKVMFGVSHIPKNIVPDEIPRPSYYRNDDPNASAGSKSLPNIRSIKSTIKLGTDEETRMRRACTLAKETLDYAGHILKTQPGITTLQIDALVHKFISFQTGNEEPEMMEPGDCFTIEPIIIQTGIGQQTPLWIWADGWTASTENGARGTVFEHTMMITNDGVEVLT